jgi:hypothetical protein
LSPRFLMSCFVGGSMLLWDPQCIWVINMKLSQSQPAQYKNEVRMISEL